MEMSEKINELTAALVASQSEFEAVSKDKNGYNYKYATLQNIVQNTRPYLVENGITVMQFPTNTETSIGVVTLMSHTSGQWVKSAFTMPIQHGTKMSDAQESGKVITYARRYAYAAVLGIVVDEDTDAAKPKNKQPAKPQNEALLPNQLKKFNTVGSSLYGDEWDDKRPELISHVTGGESRSSKDATYDQLGTLINGMNTKLKAKKTEPKQEALIDTPATNGAHA